jgi:hypothetical protein
MTHDAVFRWVWPVRGAAHHGAGEWQKKNGLWEITRHLSFRRCIALILRGLRDDVWEIAMRHFLIFRLRDAGAGKTAGNR